uniref:J domain-containing protein n=1 Tax=Panagrolaimus superbus TaxID=310955 RepID=A0A914YEK7_9BILA
MHFLLSASLLLLLNVQYSYGIGFAPGIYCGYENCYEVIGIDRDEFNKSELSKKYRQLARQFHPDRVKDKSKVEESEEKFRLVTTAYETLKDDETRGYYDYYLDHPEERYYNYYQYYRMRTAPKVDVRYVILGTVLFISTIQYLSAVQKYSEALKYACSQPKFKNNAFDIAKEKNLLEFDPKTGKAKKKQKSGVDIEKVITSIIEENISVSGGYKRASLKDTLAWNIILLPLTFPKWLYYKVGLAWKKHKGVELSKEDKEYLICNNLGITHEQFECLEEPEIELYFERELWDADACAKYKKEKEVEEKEKMLNSGRYKQYKRFMKRNAGSTISFLEE